MCAIKVTATVRTSPPRVALNMTDAQTGMKLKRSSDWFQRAQSNQHIKREVLKRLQIVGDTDTHTHEMHMYYKLHANAQLTTEGHIRVYVHSSHRDLMGPLRAAEHMMCEQTDVLSTYPHSVTRTHKYTQLAWARNLTCQRQVWSPRSQSVLINPLWGMFGGRGGVGEKQE